MIWLFLWLTVIYSWSVLLSLINYFCVDSVFVIFVLKWYGKNCCQWFGHFLFSDLFIFYGSLFVNFCVDRDMVMLVLRLYHLCFILSVIWLFILLTVFCKLCSNCDRVKFLLLVLTLTMIWLYLCWQVYPWSWLHSCQWFYHCYFCVGDLDNFVLTVDCDFWVESDVVSLCWQV